MQSINIETMSSRYLEENMGKKKIDNLFYHKCYDNSNIISFQDLGEELRYTYRHSLHSTRGNLIEFILKNYIDRDNRFTVINKKKETITVTLPEKVMKRVNEVIAGYRSRIIDLKDERTFTAILIELFELVKNSPKIDMRNYTTQIDLLFKDKNNSKMYYYEIKSKDNNDMKSDFATLTSYLMTYCSIVQDYNISTYDDIEMGVVYVLESKHLIARMMPMCHNGAMSFAEFCEQFYTVEEAQNILNSIEKGMQISFSNIEPYLNKVLTVYNKNFKGSDFTKRQFISAIDSFSYKK